MTGQAASAPNYKFPKSSRLSSKKQIGQLFTDGQSLFCYPFKVLHLCTNDDWVKHHAILITVPSKKFKRAVDRNLIKRRIREAFRLNQSLLPTHFTGNSHLLIAFIYVGKEIHNFDLVQTKLKETLLRLKKTYTEKSLDNE
ncbi:MAG: ribonuclease P protein component [Cyclobacteriaceae bacterium]